MRRSGRPRAYRLALAVAAAAAATCCVQAQEPAPTQTLTLSTHLVQVTVIARDSQGRPAAGLTKDDLTVRDEGKPRRISFFELESAGMAPRSAEPVAANVFSNREPQTPRAGTGRASATGVTGNVTILLLDALNTLSGSHPQNYEETPVWMEDGAGLYAKQQTLKALKLMDPHDRVAIYGLSSSLRLLCDFTCDRQQAIAAVMAYDGTSKTLRESAEPQAYHFPGMDDASFEHAVDAGNQLAAANQNGNRATMTLMSLRLIARHVAAIPGRKNLIWLTADLPISGEAAARICGPQNMAIYPLDGRGLMAAQVLSDTPKPLGSPPGISAMLEMADQTGGRAYVNTNGLAQAMREVVEDTGARYTIGFYVNEEAVDNKFHSLKLHVSRPGITLEAPQGYFAVKDVPRTEGRQAQLLAALENPYPMTVVPLDITAAKLEKPKPNLLALTGSIGIASMPMATEGEAHTAELEVYVVQQDAAGNVLRQEAHPMQLKLTPQQYAAYRTSGIGFRQVMEPKSNATVVRVVVRDAASGQMGSVILPLRQVH